MRSPPSFRNLNPFKSKRNFSLRMDDDQIEAIDLAASSTQTNRNDIIRAALDHWFATADEAKHLYQS